MGKKLEDITSMKDLPVLKDKPKERRISVMKIKMLETKPGVDDGEIYPVDYKKGKTYDVGSGLGRVFVDEGWAEDVKKEKKPETKKQKPRANKALKGAPENK